MASKDKDQVPKDVESSELEEFVANPEVIEVVDKKNKTKRGRPTLGASSSSSKEAPTKKKPLTDEAVR